jgi:rhodanese-related sulfurtransferase
VGWYALSHTCRMKMISLSSLRVVHSSQFEYALFDVREPAQAHRGHIFGATFLPRRLIEQRVGTLVPDRSTTIVLYDAGLNDQRAVRAAQTLARLGYTDVCILRDGIAGWVRDGESLTQGSNVPSKLFGEQVYESERVPKLPVGELYRWQQEKNPVVVCDIRSPEEYRRSRIPGAVGAFGADLALLAHDLQQRNMPVVVHCSGRTRSIIACQTLRLLGVNDVYALEDGTMGWRLAGLALETGEGEGALVPGVSSRERGRLQAMALAQQSGAQFIEADLLTHWVDRREAGAMNVYVIDVRQLPEFLAGHIPGATALPGGLAIQRTDEFIAVRSARIVLVDDDLARACLTAYWFKKMGLPNVYVLAGGLSSWQQMGGILETGRAGRSMVGSRDVVPADAVLSCEALRARLSQVIVWDVDTQEQYLKARLPGAQWVPFGELEQRADERSPSLPCVLTSRDGQLAAIACANLVREGVRDVGFLEGGVRAWADAGFPMESGPTPQVAEVSDVIVQPYDAGMDAMRSYLAWEKELTDQQRWPSPLFPHYSY